MLSGTVPCPEHEEHVAKEKLEWMCWDEWRMVQERLLVAKENALMVKIVADEIRTC